MVNRVHELSAIAFSCKQGVALQQTCWTFLHRWRAHRMMSCGLLARVHQCSLLVCYIARHMHYVKVTLFSHCTVATLHKALG
jgi:hypothetical protein